jgi:large subunit ribosomal protein L15
MRAGFEGGQMPLQRRIPKRGFVNIFAKEIAIVNLSAIDEKFEDGAVVDLATLLENKIVRKANDGLKVLGNGEITKKITVKAAVFSATAKEKIEAAGGKIEVE